MNPNQKNDGVPQETKDYFIKQELSKLIQILNWNELQEYADILIEIQSKRPKVYVVRNWPDEILLNGVDIMIMINGIISNLGCEIVVE
jgi:hypothetical protein